MKTQKLLSHLRKCIEEYDLIRDNDRITVGLSGGKDSLVLLYALKRLSEFYPVPFTLQAVTVDLGFFDDLTPLSDFCNALEIPYFIEKTEIGAIVFRERKEENPCSLCANMRRGALVNAALRNSSGVIALGHHRDDYLTTLLLSLFYEGRFYTFAPSTSYEDREVRIIRPMLYVPEASLREFALEMNFPVVKNRCPADSATKRREMADLLQKLQKEYPDIRNRLLHAVKESRIPDWETLKEGRKDHGR